jgi:DeoR family fructose operon transcriptional repressor
VNEKENKGVRHMLAEERFSRILSIIEAEGSATIQELMTALDASESTVRRDLITMDENGLLTKVHGGAIARRV